MSESRPFDETPRSGDVTSLTLLERVRSRDSAAWQRLVELYTPLVLFWCRRAGLGPEDCQDVVQEIFAAVARGLARFRHEKPGDTFRGWIRVIARNQIGLHFRRQSNRPKATGGTTAHLQLQQMPEERPQEDESDGQTDRRERDELLRRALKLIRCEFEERTWRAFWMTAVEQLPSAEVALQLQMTPGAVRQAKYRILRRLRTELGDLLD